MYARYSICMHAGLSNDGWKMGFTRAWQTQARDERYAYLEAEFANRDTISPLMVHQQVSTAIFYARSTPQRLA